MPRLRLPDRPDALWHITQRVNWQFWHLHSELAYQMLRTAVEEARERFDMEMIAYVAMSNHFHSIVRSPNAERFRLHTTKRTKCRHRRPLPHGHPRFGVVGQYVRKYSVAAAHRIQRTLDVSGHFWEGRHDRVLIQTPRQLAATIAYIHRNPVKAGMVVKPEDYGRSSAGFWTGLDQGDLPLLTRGEPLFDCDLNALLRFVSDHQGSERIDAVMTSLAESGIRPGTAESLRMLERLLDDAGLPPHP